MKKQNFAPYICSLLALLYGATDLRADYNPIERVSVASGPGSQGNGSSNSPALHIMASDNARYVVFESNASDLVSGDTNGKSDIFLYDRSTDTIERVSVATSGSQANGDSYNPSVSADGRYVVFESDATDLVAGDTNGVRDIFVRDRNSNTTVRVSTKSDGSQANGASYSAMISSDGTYVVFASDATDLVAGDTNGKTDIFRKKGSDNSIIRVSVDSSGSQANGNSTNPSVNSDGSLIVFQSDATDLVGGDTNGVSDIFLRNVTAGTTVRVSESSSGSQANGASTNPAISDDGSTIAFQSDASDLVSGDTNGVSDIFVYVVATKAVTRVSVKTGGTQANGASMAPSLSRTGNFVIFESDASNISTNTSDTNNARDVFVHDIANSKTVRVSVKTNNGNSNGASMSGKLNDNGHYAVFASDATNFVSGDTNGETDIFVVNLQCLTSPAGITEEDQDSDGTKDCSDDCPEDPAKIAEGQCGCGVADTDTDGDGTADCNDECPSDASKTSKGDCGCGNVDNDGNGNGISDCLDPTTATKPRRVRVRKLGRGRIRVIMPNDFANVRFIVQVRKNRRVIKERQTSRHRFIFRLGSRRGTFVIRYWIKIPGSAGISKISKKRKFRL